MALIRRQKATIIVLALYWPAVFVLAHIPIPQVVREAQVSDKSLHLLAYMILTFLLWSAVKPREKVHWRKAAVWRLLVIVIAYGICDECLQYYVAGRSMDARDLVADVIGAVAALGVLTFLSFWPTALIVAGTTIYTLAVFTRANLIALLPVTTTAFHLAAYAVFTLLWMGCMSHWLTLKKAGGKWFVVSISVPTALMLVTKASAVISGKAFEGWDMVAAAAGMLGAIVAMSVAGVLGPREAKNAGFSAVDG
jgi:VanZ family protein